MKDSPIEVYQGIQIIRNKMIKSSQSLLDYLNTLFPGLKDMKVNISQPDNKTKEKLYAMWNDCSVSGKRIKNKNYSKNDIDQLKSAGLISLHNDEIELTHRGVNVIKNMVLNDESSSFDKKSNSIKLIKQASIWAKSGNWYNRIRY